MDGSRIALIIPAYNEESTIQTVVLASLKYGQPIVIDDGSQDSTGEKARRSGAIVIRHAENRGYDSALNTGFEEAYKRGFDIFITLDADGQHAPHLVKEFINMFESGADVVIGVRDKKARIAERIFSFYTKVICGVDDPLCGMKGYRRTVYESLGHFDSYGSIGTELFLYAARNKFAVNQVRFTVKDRADSPRFGHSFRSNVKILRALFRDII